MEEEEVGKVVEEEAAGKVAEEEAAGKAAAAAAEVVGKVRINFGCVFFSSSELIFQNCLKSLCFD